MRHIVIIATVALALIMAPTASAGMYAHYADGTPAKKYNKWARLMRVAEPDATVLIREHNEPPIECGTGAVACVYPNRDGTGYDLDIMVMPDDPRMQRLVFWHEVGHVFDYAMLKDTHRYAFEGWIGEPIGTWNSEDYATTPNEVFARTYAACAVLGPKLRKGQNAYAEWTGEVATQRNRHAKTCSMIERLAH